jgi:23S rRNA (adenine2503-C2)-methyltransferase
MADCWLPPSNVTDKEDHGNGPTTSKKPVSKLVDQIFASPAAAGAASPIAAAPAIHIFMPATTPLPSSPSAPLSDQSLLCTALDHAREIYAKHQVPIYHRVAQAVSAELSDCFTGGQSVYLLAGSRLCARLRVPLWRTPMPTPLISLPGGPAEAVAVPRATPPRGDGRLDLVGLDRAAIAAALAGAGLVTAREARMRARQLSHWIYHRGATDFAAMSDLGKDLRGRLADHFHIGRPEIVEARVSTDGTRKWLLRSGGEEYETVFIPDADRGTLCVSSQVGCTLNCRFCHTGTMRLVRNLTAAEIVGQVLLARDALGEWPRSAQPTGETSAPEGRLLTNIVMMGMGEPLYNFENVRDALRVVMDGEGLALSKRRITLSTSGVVPMMARAGEEIGVNLAVSLHAVTKEVRDVIVPLNRKYGIEELLEACAAYPGANNARRITFEYVMLDGVNDSDADARELVRLIRHYRLPAKVNLIPFNPWPGAPYRCSPPARIARFSEIVFSAGISAPIRRPRGADIMAACGQLKSASEKLSRAELDRRAAEKEAAW